MAKETPSRLYRTAVRQALFRYVPRAANDPDAELLTYLETHYAAEKASLASAKAGRAPEKEIAALRNGLFVFAAGLFAYGHVEAAEDVIDCIPSSGAIRNLALALQAMLPLPTDLNPLQDPERLRGWLRDHRGRLRWEESSGTYVATE